MNAIQPIETLNLAHNVMTKVRLLAFLLGCCITQVTSAQLPQDSLPTVQTTSTTISIKVKGITCAGDLVTIQENIQKLPGIQRCEAGKASATTRFTITYNAALVRDKEIFQAIESTPGCEDVKERPYKVKQ